MESRKLSKMIDLTYDYNDEFYHYFPDELLIAIFWEETLFRNIEQYQGKKGQVGLGFGQVQEDTLPLIKARMGRAFEKGLITADDRLSVQVAAYALETFRRGMKSGSPENAYKAGYASATGALKHQAMPDGRTREKVAHDVWQASLDLLNCSWDERDKVRAALNRARLGGSLLDSVIDT